MQPLRISRMARRIDDFQFRMNRVCRLLSYVPNAHRDPISINQNSNKKSPGVKPEISRFTYRFHSVVTEKLTTSGKSLQPSSLCHGSIEFTHEFIHVLQGFDAHKDVGQCVNGDWLFGSCSKCKSFP